MKNYRDLSDTNLNVRGACSVRESEIIIERFLI